MIKYKNLNANYVNFFYLFLSDTTFSVSFLALFCISENFISGLLPHRVKKSIKNVRQMTPGKYKILKPFSLGGGGMGGWRGEDGNNYHNENI